MAGDRTHTLQSIDLPLGLRRTAIRDDAGRLVGLTQTLGSESEWWTAARDAQGRVLELAHNPGWGAALGEERRSFRYRDGRLISERTSATSARVVLWRYDAAGNRTAEAVFADLTNAGLQHAAGALPLNLDVAGDPGTWTAPADDTVQVTGTGVLRGRLVAGTVKLGPAITLAVDPVAGAAGLEILGLGGVQIRALWQRTAGQGRLVVERDQSGVITTLAASDWIADNGDPVALGGVSSRLARVGEAGFTRFLNAGMKNVESSALSMRPTVPDFYPQGCRTLGTTVPIPLHNVATPWYKFLSPKYDSRIRLQEGLSKSPNAGPEGFVSVYLHEGQHGIDIERFGGLTHLLSESRLPIGKGFARYFFEWRGYRQSHLGQFSILLPFRSFKGTHKWQFGADAAVVGAGTAGASYGVYDLLKGE